MCGLAGYARSRSSKVPLEDRAVLEAMTAALAHRGPDACGHRCDGRVALGHRRLAVIDRAGGAQPMTDEALGVTVVFNGEIYNYRELNETLRGRGYAARTRSDTETLLHAWAEWGERCVEHLNGMFAFVVHDSRRSVLFGVRDRMGQKPLYYAHHGDLLVFGSEAKAVLAHPAARRELDHEALLEYLVFEHVPAPRTAWRGVRKLGRGQRFRFDLEAGRLSVDAWWAPGPRAEHGGGEREWIERVRAAVDGAVERRLLADVPLGVLLSGGIDSAMVAAAMARRVGPGRIRSFSIGFDDPRFDESAAAREVADHVGTDHHEKRLTARDVTDALPAVCDALDEPFADPSVLPTYLLARFARGSVTVALTGDGGDELFAGYPTFTALPAARFYDAMVPRPVHRHVVRPLAGALRARNGYFSIDFKVDRFLRGLKAAPHERLWRWLGALEPEAIAGLLEPAVHERLDAAAPFARLRVMHDAWRGLAPIDLDCRMLAATYLADGVLTKVDRATMACSLEARSPLLDPEVVALADAVPPELKVRRGRLKYVLRQALFGRVPPAVLDRPKRGFAPPVGAWFRHELRDELLDTLGDRTIRDGGLFRPEAVRRLIDEHLAGRRDHRKPLFTLFMFERWRQTHAAARPLRAAA